MKRKPKLSSVAIQMANVAKAVKSAIEIGLMKVEGDTVYLFRSAFPADKKAQEAWVKNLYYFALLDKKIVGKDALYVKDIETDALIAFYKNKQVMIA